MLFDWLCMILSIVIHAECTYDLLSRVDDVKIDAKSTFKEIKNKRRRLNSISSDSDQSEDYIKGRDLNFSQFLHLQAMVFLLGEERYKLFSYLLVAFSFFNLRIYFHSKYLRLPYSISPLPVHLFTFR